MRAALNDLMALIDDDGMELVVCISKVESPLQFNTLGQSHAGLFDFRKKHKTKVDHFSSKVKPGCQPHQRINIIIL